MNTLIFEQVKTEIVQAVSYIINTRQLLVRGEFVEFSLKISHPGVIIFEEHRSRMVPSELLIESLCLTPGIMRSLGSGLFVTIGQLSRTTEKHLLSLPGFGPSALKILKERLMSRQVSIGENILLSDEEKQLILFKSLCLLCLDKNINWYLFKYITEQKKLVTIGDLVSLSGKNLRQICREASLEYGNIDPLEEYKILKGLIEEMGLC